MNVKAYRISLVILAVLIIIASIISFNYINQKKNISDSSIVQASQFLYYLKEYDEKIGVYKANEDSPFMTIEVYVKTLPSVDQEELKKGIMVENDAKLKTIIEDYES